MKRTEASPLRRIRTEHLICVTHVGEGIEITGSINHTNSWSSRRVTSLRPISLPVFRMK